MSDITEAAMAIKAGKLVVFPTETVYGLGADATNGKAVAAIFAAKERPQINPLIVHFASPEDAKAEVVWNDVADKLATAFWPGPLTLVLNRQDTSHISLLVSAGMDSVAVRCPAHDMAHELLTAAGCPVAAPSANPSGKLSVTQAGHIASKIRNAAEIVLDAGPSPLGIESTVVDARSEPVRILRPGSVTEEDIKAKTGLQVQSSADAPAPLSPGQLASHYAPNAELRLNATEAEDDEVLLAFGPEAPEETLNLSLGSDLAEAAANLFHMLRELDQMDGVKIAVMPIPDEGVGRALNDRLKRAAAQR